MLFKRIVIIGLLSLLMILISQLNMSYGANLELPGKQAIEDSSIAIDVDSGNSVTSVKNFWYKILGLLRMGISGIALIYIVMIGVYMIIGSDSEEKVKKQRQQITYVLIWFLFLNVPNLVYTIFTPDTNATLVWGPNFTATNGWSLFWNTSGFEWIIGNLIAFLRVFVFWVAVTMFSWWLFNLIVSAGDDEKRKKATNRIVYGTIGLIFMGFVSLWWELIALGDFNKAIPNVTGTLFNLVMYFAAPIAIFMIIWWGYYFITSAGDEERMKKGKSILINTGIALIILLSALSFISELSTFQL